MMKSFVLKNSQTRVYAKVNLQQGDFSSAEQLQLPNHQSRQQVTCTFLSNSLRDHACFQLINIVPNLLEEEVYIVYTC